MLRQRRVEICLCSSQASGSPAVDADGAQTVSILQGMQVCRQQQLQVRSIEGADLGPYKIQSKFHRASRASR